MDESTETDRRAIDRLHMSVEAAIVRAIEDGVDDLHACEQVLQVASMIRNHLNADRKAPSDGQ